MYNKYILDTSQILPFSNWQQLHAQKQKSWKISASIFPLSLGSSRRVSKSIGDELETTRAETAIYASHMKSNDRGRKWSSSFVEQQRVYRFTTTWDPFADVDATPIRGKPTCAQQLWTYACYTRSVSRRNKKGKNYVSQSDV